MDEGKRLPPEERNPEPLKKKKHRAGLVLGIFVGFLVLGYGAACVWAACCDTVMPRTSVLGVELSGLTEEEAAKAWRRQSEAVCADTVLTLTEEEQCVAQVPLCDWGVSITPKEAAHCAWQVGRSGNVLENGFALLRTLVLGTELVPALTVDDAALDARIAALVETLDNTVVDGGYCLDKEGALGPGLYLTKPRDGRQLDGEALREEVGRRLQAGDLGAIPCHHREVQGALLDVAALYETLQGTVAEARYDHKTDGITPSRVGVKFDLETVEQQWAQAKEGQTFLAEAEVEFPHVTTEDLEAGLFRDVLGTYTTTVTGSSTRIHNVYLAAQKISGHVYNAGETFWYNATVGQRTVAAGFGAAPAYVGGKTVDEVGGGICQVSSTLYYAALLANMKIVTRYCHQFAPSYIMWGCDATVSWGGPDFAFRNNTEYPIMIVTDWNNNELTVSILGTKTDDTYVEMTNQVLSSTGWSEVYEVNEEMLPGSEPVVVQTPYTGYYVKTYRNVYDGDGNLISSTFEASSDYESRNRIIQVDRQTYEAKFGGSYFVPSEE